MSSIVRQKVGKHTYLYESFSYRDAFGKPRNKRTTIGKLDPVTGKPIYKPEYLERMRQAGTPVDVPEPSATFTLENIRKSSVRELGSFYLLHKIAQQCGLIKALQESIPEHWERLFVLACYLVSSGDPFLYCENWVQNTECIPVGSMTSQRISELLSKITFDQREAFYQAWCKIRSEKEYLALDTTSISSYSQLIDEVEWGYNRDHEDLPQISLCLLMGETSRLPVYQTLYSGSLKDVSTLDTTISKFEAIAGNRPILLIMDKGFYSAKNVNSLLGRTNAQFVMPVPFTANFAKKNVESERKDIDKASNTLILGSQSIRAVTKIRSWNPDHRVYIHVYYNPLKAMQIRESVFAHVAILRDQAEAEPEWASTQSEFDKYLIIRRSEKTKNGYTINIREDIIEKELQHAGWLVIMSNKIAMAKEVLRVYREKDVVEKGFLRLKNSLDLGRIRVHRREPMYNKTFIGFLSLILLSSIHQTMLKENLYQKMTMRQLLQTLSKLRVQEINGMSIQFPTTKMQRKIFQAFGVEEPV